MMKNQVAVYRRPLDGRPIIAAVSPSREGKTHDKKIYDQARMTTPPNIKRGGDTAYQGTTMETPHKKPKGKELTPEQKASNRAFSSQRVKVEHGVGDETLRSSRTTLAQPTPYPNHHHQKHRRPRKLGRRLKTTHKIITPKCKSNATAQRLYYATWVLDPDGHDIEVVHKS